MSSQRNLESFSVPRFLPEALVTLSITLPQEDQEVLFYLIACSLKALSLENNQGKSNRRVVKNIISHTPSFDCSCFECYVGFWGRWNGSPNRYLIHEAIEMFEDHMATITTASERRKNGKKLKVKEEKLQAKELIAWLGSNSDLGRENVVVRGEEKLIVNSDESSDHYVGLGLDRSFIRRIVIPLTGFIAENMRTAWSPLK